MAEDNLITLTFRSYVIPTSYLNIEKFRLDKSYQISIEHGTSLLEFTDKMFSQNKKQIGFIAINGQIAEPSRVLAQDDLVCVYGLYGGG